MPRETVQLQNDIVSHKPWIKIPSCSHWTRRSWMRGYTGNATYELFGVGEKKSQLPMNWKQVLISHWHCRTAIIRSCRGRLNMYVVHVSHVFKSSRNRKNSGFSWNLLNHIKRSRKTSKHSVSDKPATHHFSSGFCLVPYQAISHGFERRKRLAVLI